MSRDDLSDEELSKAEAPTYSSRHVVDEWCRRLAAEVRAARRTARARSVPALTVADCLRDERVGNAPGYERIRFDDLDGERQLLYWYGGDLFTQRSSLTGKPLEAGQLAHILAQPARVVSQRFDIREDREPSPPASGERS